MRLCDIIKKEEISDSADISFEITDISDNTEKLRPGAVFFACGSGEKYVIKAIDAGASAIICDVGANIPPDIPIPVFRVDNARFSYAVSCQRLYGSPSKSMKLVAVTGTNGKTSTAMLVHAILSRAGRKTGTIGTIGNFIGSERLPASYTTPPPRELAELLFKMKSAGVKYVAMEASSHALDQYRLGGLTFDIGIFTNLTRDHLDYHKTEDACAAAKARLFENCRHSIINLDDGRAKEMAWHAAGDVYYVSKNSPRAEFFVDKISCGMKKTDFTLESDYGKLDIRTSLTGDFYVYNVSFAVAAALLLGVNGEDIISALRDFSPVEGRMETISQNGVCAVIDFAHTPDALKKTLSSLRRLCVGKLITVFGCGGDRDRGKRPQMGAVAEKYSDKIIITSDNPRSERPEDIIDEIASGMSKKSEPVKIPDRAEAIRYALSVAKNGDTVVIAGKGHENHIIDASGKRPFSDRAEVEKYFREVGSNV